MTPAARTRLAVQRALDAHQATAFSVHVRARGRVRLAHHVGHARRYRLAPGRGGLVEVPVPEPVTAEHIFDLASVSKIVATQLAVLALVSDGVLQLEADVTQILPLPAAMGGRPLTVQDLLTHRSGLPAWVPLYFDVHRRADLMAALAPYVAQAVPGARRLYSDLGFLLLGAVVEARAGMRLDAYLQQRAFRPLGLRHCRFAPAGRSRALAVATHHASIYERRMIDEPAFGLTLPTSWPARPSAAFSSWRMGTVSGTASDGNAYHAMQGVAGHAGLFATAAEVTCLVRALTGPKACAQVRALRVREAVRQRFLRPADAGDYLAWWPGSWLQQPCVPADALVMPGFTGVVAMACPRQDLQVAVLSNREHVNARGDFASLKPLYAEILAAWIRPDAAAS